RSVGKHKETTALYADLKSEIEGFHDAAYKVHRGKEDPFSTYERLFVKFRAKYGEDVDKILGCNTPIFIYLSGRVIWGATS
ncbi:hypothetical protein Tco_0470171, partial [Tanacetum coccineum]